ncbi:MAG: hypothetical protein AUH29_05880 [Candidatus Rokubacteria bacterium 13_1_40CM_69_27]|nr:MAG: hypothetical protein AUH29_05880 [Candidatus Rokubacteria bacterium 13_1_40CM_69_27]OLC37469.1 MAG: hypothetical protein AUH81_06135 [Candidatus Rokubacteria bacterium 13_1_40CM_4_69_5]
MALWFEGLALVSAALFAGGALYASVAEHPGRMKAGLTVAMAEFGPSYRRAAPWQASSAALCLVSGGLATGLTSQWAWLGGAVAVGAAIPFTLVGMMPTNRRLLSGRSLREEEAARLLTRWGSLHWIRSALGLSGLIVLAFAALLR